MSGALTYHELSGAALEPWLDGLGRLRISVFREYPYLYDGTLEYERDYLKTYARSQESLVVLVTDEKEQVVLKQRCLSRPRRLDESRRSGSGRAFPKVP